MGMPGNTDWSPYWNEASRDVMEFKRGMQREGKKGVRDERGVDAVRRWYARALIRVTGWPETAD